MIPAVVPVGQGGCSRSHATGAKHVPGGLSEGMHSANDRGHWASSGHGSVRWYAVHAGLREHVSASALVQLIPESTPRLVAKQPTKSVIQVAEIEHRASFTTRQSLRLLHVASSSASQGLPQTPHAGIGGNAHGPQLGSHPPNELHVRSNGLRSAGCNSATGVQTSSPVRPPSKTNEQPDSDPNTAIHTRRMNGTAARLTPW